MVGRRLATTCSAVAIVLMSSTANAATSITTQTTEGWSIEQVDGGTVTNLEAKTTTPNGAWDASASWIGPNANGQTNVNAGVYRYVFELSNVTTLATLSGQFWADNKLTSIFFRIGGFDQELVGIFSDLSNTQFSGPQSLNLSGLERFGPVSAIVFRTENNVPIDSGSPAGFAFSGMATAVPEPGTWLLMILGLGAVGFSMRRRQSATTRYQFA